MIPIVTKIIIHYIYKFLGRLWYLSLITRVSVYFEIIADQFITDKSKLILKFIK